MVEFNSLSTVKFQHKLKPAAENIYRRLFGADSYVEDLREQGFKVHVLDQEFGIDCLLHLKSQQWISIQEKYRSNFHLKRYGDFTQEYMNACGTQNENKGEWFKLGAQLYFYGWSNTDETDFEKWFIMHISRYKLLIESLGGLSAVGRLQQNNKHGRASFYSIPLKVLKPVILKSNF